MDSRIDRGEHNEQGQERGHYVFMRPHTCGIVHHHLRISQLISGICMRDKHTGFRVGIVFYPRQGSAIIPSAASWIHRGRLSSQSLRVPAPFRSSRFLQSR
jgi:hypothetical protein